MKPLRAIVMMAGCLVMAHSAFASGGGGGGGGGGRPQGGIPGGDTGGGSGRNPSAYVAPGQSEFDRAEYMIKSGSYDDAITLLERIIRDNPKEADSLNYLGFANRKIGNFKTAFVYYQRALTADPDHKGAHEYLGELYLQIGDLANAEAQLAALRVICAVNCEEREDLAAKIGEFKDLHPEAMVPVKATDKVKAKSKPKAAPQAEAAPATAP